MEKNHRPQHQAIKFPLPVQVLCRLCKKRHRSKILRKVQPNRSQRQKTNQVKSAQLRKPFKLPTLSHPATRLCRRNLRQQRRSVSEKRQRPVPQDPKQVQWVGKAQPQCFGRKFHAGICWARKHRQHMLYQRSFTVPAQDSLFWWIHGLSELGSDSKGHADLPAAINPWKKSKFQGLYQHVKFQAKVRRKVRLFRRLCPTRRSRVPLTPFRSAFRIAASLKPFSQRPLNKEKQKNPQLLLRENPLRNLMPLLPQ